MIDLSTTYMGIPLRSPLVPSASPLSRSLDQVKRMEDAGAGAVVLHSLFEEQVGWAPDEPHPYAGSRRGDQYMPTAAEFALGPDEYLEHVRRAKAAVAVPVIASLNGTSGDGWLRYVRNLAEAGADALELSIHYLPTDPFLPGRAVEQVHVRLVQEAATKAAVPVAVKIDPFFTSVPAMARALSEAGARALVLFNPVWAPEVDPESRSLVPGPLLSSPGDRPGAALALQWIAFLHGRVQADLAASGGIHTARDAAKAIVAGAAVVMMASALLANGVDHLRAVRDELAEWMERQGCASVRELRGSLDHSSVPWPQLYERAQYVRAAGTADPWLPSHELATRAARTTPTAAGHLAEPLG